MRVVIPFDATAPKTRLAEVLDADERLAFAETMLRDVIGTVRAAGETPTVLTTESVALPVPTVVDDRPLDPLVDAAIDDGTPLAVVMADLALATPRAVRRLLTADGDVVIAPGRGGGTNALVVCTPAFHVDYHGASVRDHRRRAHAIGATVRELDSFRLSTDVDEPEDLVEVLLHGEGEAARWLRGAGFHLVTTDGRPTVRRE